MALINCPECGKQVSDQAASCPHCGYIMKNDSVSTPMPHPTKMGALQKNGTLGSIGTIAGMLIALLGLWMLFVILPFGVLLISVGCYIFFKGNSAVIGKREVECPYCGQHTSMEGNLKSFKCPSCKKRSVVKDDFLHPVS